MAFDVQGGSDTESESNEQGESREPQKHARGKLQSRAYKESDDHLSQSHSVSPSNGRPPLLKKRRTGERTFLFLLLVLHFKPFNPLICNYRGCVKQANGVVQNQCAPQCKFLCYFLFITVFSFCF